MVKDNHLLWVLIRDLNEFISVDEKQGGRSIWRKCLFLKQFIENTGGIDLGFIGKKHTWENNQEGFACIKERLDRVVADDRWMDLAVYTAGLAGFLKKFNPTIQYGLDW